MPFSAEVFDNLCAEIFIQIKPRTVLDIGCGAGKYADILRQCLPKAAIVGYECESSYASQYGLTKKYDELRCESIENIIASGLRERFDLCILGDVLEHLRKSLGHDVIHFLLYRSRYVLLVVPLQYLQDDYGDVGSEAHISSWHPREFQAFTDGVYVSRGNMWLGILRGFLSDRSEFLQLYARVKELDGRAHYFACDSV
jgi:hypothetical protein